MSTGRSSIEAVAIFRNIRLRLGDLRILEGALSHKELTWSCADHKTVAMRGSKKNSVDGEYKLVVRHKAEALDDLVISAPKGRIFEFSLEAKDASSAIEMRLGNPRSRHLTLKFSGIALDGSFETVFKILKRAEKRSQYFFLIGVLCGPTAAVMVPLTIFDEVSNVGIFYEATGSPRELSAAAGLAGISLLFLLPVSFGVWSWVTSACVQLKPRLNAASLAAYTRAAFRHPFSRVRNLYKVDRSSEQKMLFATVTSMLVAFGSLIVALLAWVFPRN
ncbi:hypothetical protein [Micromonospora wenchangensis]|uniref:hypothetical protein n=1 Tax=Micromonospora wenchangensis TaxID=1185415 RepID=UPI003D739FE8